MQKRLFTVFACILVMSISSFAAAKKKAMPSGPAPDKASLQKMLDDWSLLDSSKMAKYYAPGNLNFFDIAPLKYNNWAEYQTGVGNLLKGYKSLKLTMNDDAQIHQEGDLVWATATLKEDAVTAAGKRELATMRWTVIFQFQDGKWLVVHEHTSEPLT